VRYTARWSFFFFWLSYTGGALAILFGPVFAGLARRARALGLAFAAAPSDPAALDANYVRRSDAELFWKG